MRNLFLLAAVICFGMAIIKFFAARTPANAPPPGGPAGNISR